MAELANVFVVSIIGARHWCSQDAWSFLVHRFYVIWKTTRFYPVRVCYPVIQESEPFQAVWKLKDFKTAENYRVRQFLLIQKDLSKR